MEMHFNSQVRETKENVARSRRRNIMYLIHSYLQEEGLFESAETLFKESKLNNEYKVCDNVDLNIILQEYTNYYFVKFDKYPIICKRKDPDTAASKDCKGFQAKNKKKEVIPTKPEETSTVRLENSLSITGFKTEDNHLGEKFDNILNHVYEDRCFSKFIAKIPQDIQPIIEQIYSESKSRYSQKTWNDIVGLNNVKETLKEAIQYPEMYSKLFDGLESWKSILLYGPPGSGKTLLAKALANECNKMFINISPGTILSKWRGESEKIIKAVFQLGRYYSPSIIFIDEIDSLCSKKGCYMEHEASLRLKNEILVEIDGINCDLAQIFFLATSNSPWNIDRAMLRRMEKRIHVPLPDNVDRKSFFDNYCRGKTVNKIDSSELSDLTEGYSGADIAIICKEAVMNCIREEMNTSNTKDNIKGHLNTDAFRKAISQTKPSVKDLQAKYISWNETMGSE